MKNEILDELTRDSFSDFLEKGEKVLWEGQPKFRTKFFSVLLGDRKALTLIGSFLGLIFLIYFCMIFLIPILLGILFSNFIVKIVAVIILVLILSPQILNFIKRKKTIYLITNRQIIFQLWRGGKKQFYQIPLSAIQDLVVQKNGKNYGIIFFVIKNPQNLQFDTYNLRSGERRHQPTFEMIEEINAVAQLIRQGIEQNN